VADADCGVVLDRRIYPELGPDGDDLPPDAIVAEIAEFVLSGVLHEYPAGDVPGLPSARS